MDGIEMNLIKRTLEVYKKRGIKVLMKASYDNIRYKKAKFFSKDDYPIIDVHGFRMHVCFNDNGASKELYLYKNRESATTQIIKEIVKPNMTILEVGANIGYYALMEAHLMNDKGTIYAIEPFEKNMEILQRNIELNNFKSIETFQLACSNKSEEKQLFISESYNLCNLSKEGKNSVTVKTVSVDSFMKGKRQPDIIRMDIEGYEYYVIDGMENTLKKAKYLMIEWHAKSGMKDLDWVSKIEKIISFGFKPVYFTEKKGYYNEIFVNNVNEKNIVEKIKERDNVSILFKKEEKK